MKEDITMESTEKKERLPFSEWLDNVWYRYKWMILAGAVLAVFLVIALIQLFSARDADVKVLYIGPAYLTVEDSGRFKESMEKLAPDYDGDGHITTDVLDITLNRVYDSSDPMHYVIVDQNNEANTRFQTEVRVGDAVLYILDRTFFDECVKLGLLAPLDAVLGKGNVPENALDGYGIIIGNIDAQYLPGFDKIQKDMVLCLRRSPDEDEIKYNRSKDFWENNRQTFINIVNYKR